MDIVDEPLGELVMLSLIAEPKTFEVITSSSAQDVRGVEVEVLDDNGDGWIEMRSLDGVTFGWMAEFPLRDSRISQNSGIVRAN